MQQQPDLSFFDPAYRAWREKVKKAQEEQLEKQREKMAEFEQARVEYRKRNGLPPL
jgi:hypothetical protein